ncbi:MAG: YhfC family glutamic-type intramembrane protease [Thermaerobacter sp.]|nr:YhfC family intramembrane metalloprotease [Bacillota bacterium]REJ37790.1 MAG: YhfC family intramembrane metalloprotease [Bacillota bacterium]
MVSAAAMAGMAVTALLSFLLPVTLMVHFRRRHGASMRAVVVGAAVFVIFQFIARGWLLGYLDGQAWYRSLMASTVVMTLWLSLSAGIFEEVGRYLAFSWPLEGMWDRKHGIAYGLGHGGIEAMFFAGLPAVNNLMLSLAINSGTFDTLVAPQMGAGAELIKTQLLSTPPALFLLAGVERACALAIQVALSLLVLAAVRGGRPVLVVYAVLLHGLVNFVALLLAPVNMYLAQAWVLAAAVAAWRYIRRWRDEPAGAGSTPAA